MSKVITDWSSSRNKTDSNLAMMKVSTQGDISDKLRTVHQICQEPAKKKIRISEPNVQGT